MAALEEVRAVIRCCGLLVLVPIVEKGGEDAGRRSAHGVAEEVYRMVVVPLGIEARHNAAITLVAVFCGMSCAVVNTAALDVGVEFTGAVPDGCERALSGLIGDKAAASHFCSIVPSCKTAHVMSDNVAELTVRGIVGKSSDQDHRLFGVILCRREYGDTAHGRRHGEGEDKCQNSPHVLFHLHHTP